MPYIKQYERKEAMDALIANGMVRDVGTLNYLITEMCLAYLETKGELRYKHFNAIIGALECAKQEFYRRLVSVYEDSKIRENGDVYER